MIRRIAGATVALATLAPLAHADPQRCVDSDDTVMFGSGPNAEAEVCIDRDTCWLFDGRDAPRFVAGPPPLPPADPQARVDDAGKKVCNRSGCKPLGKRLRAVIAEIPPSERPETLGHRDGVDVSDDLAIVLVNGDAWNVARDKKLVPKRSRDVTKQIMQKEFDIAGNYLVVSWIDQCASTGCGETALVGADGNVRGKPFALSAAEALDDGHVVFWPRDSAVVTIVDAHAATVLSTVALPSELGTGVDRSARLDDHRVALLKDNLLVIVDVASNGKASVSKLGKLPACP